jgi:nicotinamide-nucleotide amidase
VTPDWDALVSEAETLLALCRARGLKLATAESCTGGLIAATLTEVPGSSYVFERGFVTYSNEAKVESLGVRAELIERHGAVSDEVARAMAAGALAASRADIAVAVTGVAGPGGGTAEKPVGLVHFAAVRADADTLHRTIRFGDMARGDIRRASVAEAFRLLRELAEVNRNAGAPAVHS